jgi:two-component system chemotaxis response regulator CheB
VTVRVLIVDDSAFFREVLRAELAAFSELEIVGEAGDGRQAIALAAALCPDVISMDVVLPLVGGLEAIRAIMASRPTPIVVLSGLVGRDARLGLDAIAAGALELVGKPLTGFDASSARRLVELLTVAAASRPGVVAPLASAPPRLGRSSTAPRFVAIAASTGGPPLLRALLAGVGPGYPATIAIVQHTSAGFVAPLASWLADACALEVAVAVDGARARAGAVLIAPDDRHLTFDPGGAVVLSAAPPEGGHRPSADALFRSLARSFGAAVVGLVLSGMGSDGARGLAAIAGAGGPAWVLAPDDAAVAAMPRAALAAVPEAQLAPAATLPGLLAALVRGGPA